MHNNTVILVHLCLEEALPIDRLHNLLQGLISNNVGQKLLKPLFALIIKEKGQNFLQNAWISSGKQLEDFMSSTEVPAFIQENVSNIQIYIDSLY